MKLKIGNIEKKKVFVTTSIVS